MSYLGQVELKASEIRRIDVTGSTSATHTLTWTPASEQSLIITINGIKQQNNYSISGVTLTLDDALLSADKMEVIGILDIGEATIPPDDSITTAMVKDDAITAAKLANAINTDIAANTAKVTNATHTGDVTGATALTIATDAVDIAMLSATGTASATTFLRGDNAWATPSGGKILQVVTATKTDTFSHNSATWVDVTDLTVTITPAATSSKILVLSSVSFGTNGTTGYVYFRFHSSEASGPVFIGDTAGSRERVSWGGSESTSPNVMGNMHLSFIDSPSTTSAVTYKMQIYDQAVQIVYVNKNYADSDSSSYTRGASSITVLEIGA